jgi:O-antigen ligase
VRAKAAVAVVALTGVVFVLAPGVLASLGRLFLSIGSTDTSAQSRTDSYGMAAEYIGHSPVLGRGFATFLPSYRILDNQLLGLLIEVGVVGLLAFLGMIAVAAWCGIRTRKRSTDPVAAQLGQACAAGLCAGVVSLALFDGLAFPMSGCMIFLLAGVSGAGWRIARERTASEPVR